MGLLAQLFKTGVKSYHYANRKESRIEYFNWRWEHLNEIHQLVLDDFVIPLEPFLDNMTNNECIKLEKYVQKMSDWQNDIIRNINEANQNHLSSYATAIKKVAMKSMMLCKKYCVYSDIETVKYISSETAIYLNDEKHYTFR
ncbi:MAG: hypothetical protein U5L00_04355 [Desulfovermiculus sp.]|nr:hypothetical protein [Desulfovermiculus sp.]